MTIAETATGVEQSEVLRESPVAPETEPEPATRRGDWRRRLGVGIVVVFGIVLVVALFTGPVERQWFKSRQHHLAADLQVARQGLAPSQAIGVLQVPRLGINLMVVEGDTAGLLRGGPGHRVNTARPGARGNSVILGHRQAWGGPFADLHRVREGDYIVIQSRDRKSGEFTTFVYRARSTAAVTAAGSRKLMGRSTDHRLTLVTGRGGTLSDDRLVVSAVSGKTTRDALRTSAVRATTPGSSILFNAYVLLAVLAFAIAAVAFRYLRRRSAGRIATAVVLVPLLAAGAAFLLLDLTLMLPPLQ